MIVKLPEDILQGFFLKYREVEMRPMRGVDMGIEWKPLTLESKNDDDEVLLILISKAYLFLLKSYTILFSNKHNI